MNDDMYSLLSWIQDEIILAYKNRDTKRIETLKEVERKILYGSVNQRPHVKGRV